MTKAQKQEQQDAIARLREWIKPGDTVYTILDHVSTSGMTRHIRVLVPLDNARLDFRHPNHAVGLALDLRHQKRGDGLVMGGCGMDMGFALVYDLSYSLYADYDCLGECCPAAEHSNNARGPRGAGVSHHDGYALRQRWI